MGRCAGFLSWFFVRDALVRVVADAIKASYFVRTKTPIRASRIVNQNDPRAETIKTHFLLSTSFAVSISISFSISSPRQIEIRVRVKDRVLTKRTTQNIAAVSRRLNSSSSATSKRGVNHDYIFSIRSPDL